MSRKTLMKNNRVKTGWAASVTMAGLAISLYLMSGCTRSGEPSSSLAAVPEPADVGHTSVEKVDLRGVQFRPDGSIRSDSKPILDSAIELLKTKPNATVYVDAYCDLTGGARLNQHLSDERAAAVATYLETHGITADHIVPRGFGASHFVASNTTAADRSQNRRIELVVQADTSRTVATSQE